LINIEVNFNNKERVQNKNMKYVCQLVLRQTKVNNKELNIKPIYQININNFDIFKKERFVYQSYLMEKEFHMKRSELFQIIDINMDFLTKIDYTEIKKDSLEKLLFILICEDNNKLDELYVGDGIMEKVRNKMLDLTEEDWQELYYNPEELQRLCVMDEVKEKLEEKVKERTLEIAKSMVKLNVSDDIIIKSTGLTQEEVNKLRNN